MLIIDTPIRYRFKPGDRVTRDCKVDKPVWTDDDPPIIKHGTVAAAYSQNSRQPYLGFYPELYDVQWDDGTLGCGYLPHGIRGER